MKHFLKPAIAGSAIAYLLLSCGCGKPPAAQQGPPSGGEMPPANAVVAKAEQRAVEDKISLVASLAAKEMISLVSERDGKVEKIQFTEGQHVQQGDLLFKLDQEVTGIRQREATVAFSLANKTFERGKQLLQSKTISQQEYDQAEADYYAKEAALALAKDEHEKTMIQAPFNGVIGEKEISPGQYVTRGQPLANLIQVDPLQVVFEVPERHIGSLQPGLTIGFAPEAFAGETFTGKLIYTAPLVDEKSRTLRVKAEIPNSDGRLKPGMFGELNLVFSTRENAVVIPESAIQLMGGAPMVVSVSPQGISGFQPVRVGQRFAGSAEITEGLKPGGMVVIEGFQKMGPGMKVIATAESAQHGVTPGPLFPAEAAPAPPATPEPPAEPQAPAE